GAGAGPGAGPGSGVGFGAGPQAAGSERTGVWRQLLVTSRQRRAGRTVLLGDFNTGRRGVDGSVFRHAALLGQLATLGYVDAWRRMHPDGRQMTWRGPGGASGRIDHCFLSERLAPGLLAAKIEGFGEGSGVSGGPPRLSDHAP